ncbi:MAG: hypothetical protein LBL95_07970, partial [Deltaproteobacteria bacterium]|nr:hypothetical protein [Deltaproteobacteria bacterium]
MNRKVGGGRNGYEFTLENASGNFFIRQKPSAVLFGGETITVKKWSGVYRVIYERVNRDTQVLEDLLYLRNKAAGTVRVLISDTPAGMRKPLNVDEEIFVETHYGVETMFNIMVDWILRYVLCD